ncbi:MULTISPECIES: PadR family transcriptional regulator [Amycolatopsis]|uniref:PadR family transcriptional regulator n=1 Tax=Amycolatopsis TaxID=1813 RepID=UPI001C55CB93|nr:PadR family transcriptional regulator [Amycolatopsis sp. TNS106]QXV61615.1 PadR family transcriptional regulator [Amycolatopsis sp. TNS106]
MSATRLLVLGVVRMYGKAHGYQVRRELLSWAADKWGNVQPGSIYHALKKMTTEGLLEQVEDAEPGSGPDRVAYRLTEDGETEFLVQLGRALSSDDATGYSLSAAVTFMPTLPRAQVLALLKQQLANMEAHAQSTHYAREHAVDLGKPPHVSELYRLWSAHAEANVTWMRDLIGRLEAGEYVMAGEGGDDEAVFGAPPE